MQSFILSVIVILLLSASSARCYAAESKAETPWKPHVVRQLNGGAAVIRIPAKLQIVTEPWKRVVVVPYLVYMPEKDRLLMSVACDRPLHPMVLSSDDGGATWSKPRDAGAWIGLTYLGNGKVMAAAKWSDDYGETWRSFPSPPHPNVAQLPEGETWNPWSWDPLLVDKDPNTGKVVCLVETGYTYREANPKGWIRSQGYIGFSADEGRTWTAALKIPQWQGVNEVALIRARNGDLIGACRTDMPEKFMNEIDHYSGLGVSISKDNGHTWSKLNMLYQWGRHHPSMVLLPSGDLVMTYVVRAGYVRAANGFPQFGIEAVVSRDHGQTWDLDHRYLLHTWQGNRNSSTKEWGGPQEWWAGSQATSSVLLPGGTILTAFGTGYRSEPTAERNQPSPMDVGLVQWRVGDQPLNGDRTIRDAPFDSDLRNVVDPATIKSRSTPGGSNALDTH